MTRLEGLQKWVSPLLKIQFEWSEKRFEIYHPDGQRFVSFEELKRQNRYLAMQYEEERALRLQERKWLVQVEKEAKLAKKEASEAKEMAVVAEQKADEAEQKAVLAEQKADKAAQKAIEAEMRRKILEEKLREMGINPDAL
jgi:membrane protein involved in colicin uptake